MQKLSTTHNSYFSILSIILILIASDVIAAAQKAGNWLDEPINISFRNEQLSKVLKKISEQTGVSIAYDQNLANEKVTGNYQNVKTSDAITRLFKSKNISIQVNNEKKVIIIKTFGAKSFIWVGVGRAEDFSSQITLDELNKMHSQQIGEFRKLVARNNGRTIYSDISIPKSELNALHTKQFEAYKEGMANDNKKLAGSITRAKLNEIHARQYKEYIDRSSNATIVLTGDFTRKKLNTIHEQQFNEYKKQQTNSVQKLEGKITLKELDKFHAKQHKESLLKNGELTR